jgi:hypothetical protein
MMNAAGRAGHSVVTWTRRAMDGIHTDPRRIVRRLVPRARAGDILALHDGVEPGSAGDRSPTVAAVRPLVEGLRLRGLEPVRLDELLAIPAYAPEDRRGEEPRIAKAFAASRRRRFAFEKGFAADARG